MEFKSFKSLLACFAILCSLNVSAQVTPTTIGNNVKFYLGVTGYDGNNTPSTVSTTVYDNYNFVVQLPDGDKAVATNKATFDIQMQNVATLGLSNGEIRKYFYTATTGVETGTKPILSTWLNNCYGFAGVENCNIEVIDKKGTKTFKYRIDPINSNKQIIGTANNSEDAREAWHKITSHVSNGQNASEDSKITIKQGTYVKMGGESWDFTSDVTVLSGNWQLSETVTAIKAASKVTDDVNAKDNVAIIYLPAGSTIALGGSYATLEDEATITVELSEEIINNFNGMLSTVRQKTDENKQEALACLVETFNKIVGIISESRSNINITVDFGHSECLIDVYPGSDEVIEAQTIEQYLDIQKEHVNAIGFVEYSEENLQAIEGLTNIIVKYPVAAHTNNYYYECNDFVLTDVSFVGVPAKTNYYSPVSFTALNAKYEVKVTRRNNFVCLPFDVKNENIPNCTLLTYAYYKPIYKDGVYQNNAYVYFNKRDHINAGIPFLIYENNNSSRTYSWNLHNITIVGEPDNSVNLQGTFIYTDEFTDSKHYMVETGAKELLAPMDGVEKYIWLSPFRACVDQSHDTWFDGGNNHTDGYDQDILAKSIGIAIIGDEGEITIIEDVKSASTTKNDIYTINGTKISHVTKPGLYIVNGTKQYIK